MTDMDTIAELKALAATKPYSRQIELWDCTIAANACEEIEALRAAMEKRDALLSLVFMACTTKGQSRAAHRKACIARDKAAGEWMARNDSLLRREAMRLKPSDGAIYAAASAKNLSDQRLSELIEAARHHVMTPEERRAQRRSWVIGEMGIEHPEMTREEIERIVDEVLD